MPYLQLAYLESIYLKPTYLKLPFQHQRITAVVDERVTF